MTENPNLNSDMPGDSMGENHGNQQDQTTAASSTDSTQTPAGENTWQEVGKQFQTLGTSIAEAMRTAWQNEETQRQLREMRTGLESMVKDIGKAIEDSSKTPQGQKIRQDATKAAEAIKTASTQTVQEVRPRMIDALKQLNDELQKLINRMEKKE